jgi:hypothetical protein
MFLLPPLQLDGTFDSNFRGPVDSRDQPATFNSLVEIIGEVSLWAHSQDFMADSKMNSAIEHSFRKTTVKRRTVVKGLKISSIM